MKYVLPFDLFLNESLSIEHQSYYSKFKDSRTSVVNERLNKFLDGKERIYLSLEGKEVVSPTQLEIDKYLKSIGYEISSYPKGIAISKDLREIRIGKLLGRLNPELLTKFNIDPSRTQLKDIDKGKMVVITSNYEDVAGMSCNRKNWKSCMDINTGIHKHYLERDVMYGTVVAYYTTTDDINLEEPLGRINIKPYYLKERYPEFFVRAKHINNDYVIYYPDSQYYGNIPKDVVDFIFNWVTERQSFSKKGFYSKFPELYSDNGSPTKIYVDANGKVCVNCEVDDEGYDIHGYDIGGFDRDGYDSDGRLGTRNPRQ